MALKPVEIILACIGAEQVEKKFDEVGSAGARLDANLDKVGQGDGFARAGANADALKGKLETVRNVAAGFAVAGGVGMALSDNLAQAFVEADRLGGRLESMMKGKGLEAGIEQVRKLGNEIAALTGGDDDQVSAAISGAIVSGRLQALKEYGIVIDATGQAAIDAAGKISDQAKQQEILNQVMRAGASAAENLRAGMDESTAALGEMSVRWGNLEEGFGAGSAAVKAALYSGVLSPIFDILEASPELQGTVGMIFSIGSTAVTAGASVLGLAAQVGTTALSLQGMGITGATAFAAITAGATTAAIAVGRVLLVALLAAAAMFALDKLLHRKEDNELAANIARGDEAGKKLLEIQNQKRAKKGKAALTMKEFQDDPNIDDTVTAADPAVQIADIRKQYDDLQTSGAPASAPVVVVPSIAPVVAQSTPPAVVAAPGARAPQPRAVRKQPGSQGESNVAAQMSWAKTAFGDLDKTAAQSKFDTMSRLFEKNGGFEGEAQMEAARRTIGGRRDAGDSSSNGMLSLAGIMSFLKGGGSLLNLPKERAGADSATGGEWGGSPRSAARGRLSATLTDKNFRQEQRPDGGIDLILQGRISLEQDSFLTYLEQID
jgi:hypothetical protein